MNRAETEKLLTIIQKSYPNYFKEFDAETFEVQATFWQRSLIDYSWADTISAFEYWINTQDRPPQLNQFKDLLIRTINPLKFVSAEKAWAIVTDAVKNYGSHNQEKAYKHFTEPIKSAIKSVGGWQQICSTEIGQRWDFLRKAFMESYNAYTVEGNEQFLLPPSTLKRIEELRRIEEQKRLENPEDDEPEAKAE